MAEVSTAEGSTVEVKAEVVPKAEDDAKLIPMGTASYTIDEKNVKRVGLGQRQIILRDLHLLAFFYYPCVLTFSDAKGLEGIRFFISIPTKAEIGKPAYQVTFATEGKVQVENIGYPREMAVGFIHSEWKPGSGLPLYKEPAPGWSLKFSIRRKEAAG